MAIEYPIKQNGHFTLEKLSADHLLPLIDRFLLTFILISLENVKTKINSKISIDPEFLLIFGCHHSCLLVLTYSPFEKVGLSLKRNHLHPVEGVLAIPNLRHSQSSQQSVSNALDVLSHELNRITNTFELMPIRSEGRLSETNFFSISTASLMMF